MPITIHFGRGLELFASLLVGVLAVVLVAGSDGEFYRLLWFLILVVGGISRVLLYMLHRKRADTTKINRDLHSQQPAVYEREITRQLFASNVLVSGLQGLGAEIAKNLVLSGVKSITLHDEENVELWDLSSNFLITEKDVGKNRALACVTKLQELNSTVTVLSLTRALSKEHLSNFQVVVFTNVNLEKAIEYDDYCHNQNPPICFIRSEVRGLFGNVFCDFGPEFTVFDVDGEEPRTGIIASISNDNPAIVSSVDDEWLEFQDGDLVVFSEVEGMTELNDGKPRKIKKVGAYTFTLEEDTSQFGAYKRGGIVTQVKEPKVVKFKFLREALRDPGEYLLRDFSRFDRQALLHLAFQALDKFRHDVGRFPIAGSEDDAQQLITFAVNINESFGESKLKEIDKKILEQFAYGSHAILNPMAAVFGGIVGQEVVKACSGKFHPICQFFYFDSLESLPVEPLEPSDLKPLNCRYDAQISVFGSKLQKRLEEAKIFVMGSGDWGCEFLKNLALMGVCCSLIGELTVTDDDSIEKSDRHSQLNFREWNIGEAKSTAANLINPSLNVKALEIRELAWTDDWFDRKFWKGLDVVIDALDNLKVRIYIDGPCECFQKPLLQSRTLGAKCNTQTIIPPLTENYGASLDPPEKFTLRSFPHNIDHCLTWARSEFEVLLEKTPSDVNNFFTDRQTAYDSFNKDLIQRILDCLGKDRCDTFQDCIRWARLRFEDYFCNRVKQLTFTFPEDASTSTDASFWSAPKRFPRPLAFSSNDPSHVQFIMAAAILSAEIFGIPIPEWAKNSKKLADAVDKVIVPDFQPKSGVKNEPDYSYIDGPLLAIIDDLNARLAKCADKLPSGFCMNPIQFKMDDDTNYHMDFIAGLANLRARNYSIPQVDKLKDKLIVGRIIPVIATSTAMAAGLVCLELYKVLAGGHKLEDYRNTFANLALAQFCMAEPVPPKMKYWFGMPEWDLWTIKGDPTLRELLQWFNGRGLNAYRIYNRSAYDIYNQTAYGGTTLLYNHSFHYPLNRMDKKVVDLVRQIDRVPPYRDHVDLKVACEDACGNNGYIPHVLIYFR